MSVRSTRQERKKEKKTKDSLSQTSPGRLSSAKEEHRGGQLSRQREYPPKASDPRNKWQTIPRKRDREDKKKGYALEKIFLGKESR